MKRKVCVLLAMIFVLMSALNSIVSASNISLYNNNTMTTATIFKISSTGVATVIVDYEGYIGVTTGADISIKIEKRNLLLFWRDVVDDVITVSGESYYNNFTYQLEDTGTYRCTVVYTISGTGGADDVITFEDTKTYG